MSPNVFLEGQFFEVVVAESLKDAERKEKNPAEVYSVVERILSATHP